MKKNNTLQIIAGKYRGRKLPFSDVFGLRPTPNKVRETLFNWLQFELPNKTCLDLFAGSGALSFEAISRGAKSVVCVEKNPIAFQNLTKNKQHLNLKKLEIIQQDALIFLSNPSPYCFDFVFIDPPFKQNLIKKTLKTLMQTNFVTSGSKIYIESEFEILTNAIAKYFPYTINISHKKQAGQVHYCLITLF